MSYHYTTTAQVSESTILSDMQHLDGAISHVRNFLKTPSYDHHLASLMCAYDEPLRSRVQHAVELHRTTRNQNVLVLVGMGGSILGTIAVIKALYGNNPPLRWYALDSIDTELTTSTIHTIEDELIAQNNVLLVLISKSGNSIETQINALFMIDMIQKFYGTTYHHHVAVITDEESPLHTYAIRHHFTVLTIPSQVGGRFSVFSAASLFPLAYMGIDIEQFHAGARLSSEQCIEKSLFNNAAIGAIIMAHQYKMGIIIHDMYVWTSNLVPLGNWYRQLLAESIGKEKTSAGKKHHTGITPTVSLGTADLHSVAQLYLEGPHNRMTTFLTMHETHKPTLIPTVHSESISLEQVKNAIEQSVYDSYNAADQPYSILHMPARDAFSVGQMLQLKIIETLYLAHLLEVNPYDQPGVELYKREIPKYITIPSLW